MYLEIEGLNKAFGEKKVVRDLNLEMNQGEILCLLGSSGCGKTTTLRMIGGFLAADSGTIRIDGEDVTHLSPESRPVSTVFQSYALFPNMTVIGNVMYGYKFKGIPKAEARKLAEKQLALVSLSEYADAGINEISGGQQQRVALARALAAEPKIMLLDEPLSNLDAKLRIRMRDELRELQQRLGMTMIFVTHDQEEAMVLADRIAIMNEGRLVQVGSPQEVYDHPQDPFAMRFLGTANSVTLPDRNRVCFRPEKIRILGICEDEGEDDFPAAALASGLPAETEAKKEMPEPESTGEPSLLRESAKGKKSGKEFSLMAKIENAEYLGFYMQYHAVTKAGDELLLRSDSDVVYRKGQVLKLRFSMDDVLM